MDKRKANIHIDLVAQFYNISVRKLLLKLKIQSTEKYEQ